MTAEMEEIQKSKKIPSVISFAFKDFTKNRETGKWYAKRRFCTSSFTETIGVTSGFTK